MKDYQAIIDDAAKKYGIDPAYLRQTAQIESRGNPRAISPTGAAGLFQFTRGTAADYGLTNRFDPKASSDAAARFARDNATALKSRLGRDPSNGELYLAHNQGAAGASALLSHPQENVVDALTPAYNGDRAAAARAVRVNGGSTDATAGQFSSHVMGKFAGASPSSNPSKADTKTPETPELTTPETVTPDVDGPDGGVPAGGQSLGEGIGGVFSAIGKTLLENQPSVHKFKKIPLHKPVDIFASELAKIAPYRPIPDNEELA